MATENKQITIYLPENIYFFIENYCKENKIVRKKDNCPQLATGIIKLLEILASMPSEIIDQYTPNLEKNIKQKLSSLSKEELLTLIFEAINS